MLLFFCSIHGMRSIRKKLFYFLASLIFILLTSCQPDRVCILPTSTQASRPMFRFAGGMKCEQPAPDIVEVEFVLEDETNKNSRSLWNIQAPSWEGKQLDSLVYGFVPQGFTQTAPALPMRPGNKITISVLDRYSIRGYAEVTLTK